MEDLILIIGLGIVAFLLFFLMFIIKDDKKQFLFRLVLLFFGVFFLLLIPKAALDTQDYCSVLVNETLVVHNVTTYSYDRVCFDNEHNTSDIFYKYVVRFQTLVYIYMFFYLLVEVLIWRDLLPEGMFGKKKK